MKVIGSWHTSSTNLHPWLEGKLWHHSLQAIVSRSPTAIANQITSVPFPASVMTSDRFQRIFWNIHPSDPGWIINNYTRKGDNTTQAAQNPAPIQWNYYCLQGPLPLKRNLAVGERMVATKAKTGLTQYMKDKPTKWVKTLFVPAGTSNGYTINFNIYTGKKKKIQTNKILLRHTVMNRIQPDSLGRGYHFYLDIFFIPDPNFSLIWQK